MSSTPVRIARRVAVIEPTLTSERIRTGTWRASSVYQIVSEPLSRKSPPASL